MNKSLNILLLAFVGVTSLHLASSVALPSTSGALPQRQSPSIKELSSEKEDEDKESLDLFGRRMLLGVAEPSDGSVVLTKDETQSDSQTTEFAHHEQLLVESPGSVDIESDPEDYTARLGQVVERRMLLEAEEFHEGPVTKHEAASDDQAEENVIHEQLLVDGEVAAETDPIPVDYIPRLGGVMEEYIAEEARLDKERLEKPVKATVVRGSVPGTTNMHHVRTLLANPAPGVDSEDHEDDRVDPTVTF